MTYETLSMEARSLLRRALCPECKAPGYSHNLECAFCVEREKLTMAILTHEEPTAPGRREDHG